MRAYTLGNGSMLVGVDEAGQVRDLYYPFIGRDNHVTNYTHRVGIFADGALHWTTDAAWQIKAYADHETMRGFINGHNSAQGIELLMKDTVYNEKNIFLREITITNHSDRERPITLFFGHECGMGGTKRSDTGYYDPRTKAIVHYEGNATFLARLQDSEGELFDDWSVGLYGIEGKEGTWRDAEDGVLSKNPIEHGHVDSVIGKTARFAAGESKVFYYWAAMGHFHSDVELLNKYVLDRSPQYLIETTENYWRAWLKSQDIHLSVLPDDVQRMYTRSLLVVHAHTDDHGGIIASSDTGILNQGRDTYAYVWPRDAGYAAKALIMAGDTESAKRFFQFADSALTAEGYLMHKYLPDGTVGSSWHPWIVDGRERLPIQADETAIVLTTLRHYYNVSRDIEFIEHIYNSLIKRSADFLAGYVQEDGLPKPSYDLWEEVYCVSPYTASLTCAALESAAFFSELLGKHVNALQYRRVKEKMERAITTELYDEATQAFVKCLLFKDDVFTKDATLDISGTFGVFEGGVLPADDETFSRSLATIREKLELHEGTIGGVPRNTNDGYYRTSLSAPPNPWSVTTLWLAQMLIAKAKDEKDLERPRELLSWVVARATGAGVLSEQMHPITGAPLGATPLVWSHAEFVITVIRYIEKLQDLGLCPECYPLRRG